LAIIEYLIVIIGVSGSNWPYCCDLVVIIIVIVDSGGY